MSGEWEFYTSERVARFLARLPLRTEARVLDIFDAMKRHPVVLPDDLPLVDAKGRPQWVRFRDGFAITFWLDQWEKQVRITDVGLE